MDDPENRLLGTAGRGRGRVRLRGPSRQRTSLRIRGPTTRKAPGGRAQPPKRNPSGGGHPQNPSPRRLSILAHIDMMSNRLLMEEVYKELDKIFLMSYSKAIAEIRKIHIRLMTSKTRKYNGHGQGGG